MTQFISSSSGAYEKITVTLLKGSLQESRFSTKIFQKCSVILVVTQLALIKIWLVQDFFLLFLLFAQKFYSCITYSCVTYLLILLYGYKFLRHANSLLASEFLHVLSRKVQGTAIHFYYGETVNLTSF